MTDVPQRSVEEFPRKPVRKMGSMIQTVEVRRRRSSTTERDGQLCQAWSGNMCRALAVVYRYWFTVQVSRTAPTSTRY